MATTVVHVNDPDGYDVYIGRAVHRRRLKASDWANPYRIGPDMSRERSIACYRRYLNEVLLEYPEYREALSDLRGKRLGCWCAPQACHGDVLAEMADAENT